MELELAVQDRVAQGLFSGVEGGAEAVILVVEEGSEGRWSGRSYETTSRGGPGAFKVESTARVSKESLRSPRSVREALLCMLGDLFGRQDSMI